MTLTSHQQVEDKNYQYRVQLEGLQEAQIDNKRNDNFLRTYRSGFITHIKKKQPYFNILYRKLIQKSVPFLKNDSMKIIT